MLVQQITVNVTYAAFERRAPRINASETRTLNGHFAHLTLGDQSLLQSIAFLIA